MPQAILSKICLIALKYKKYEKITVHPVIRCTGIAYRPG